VARAKLRAAPLLALLVLMFPGLVSVAATTPSGQYLSVDERVTLQRAVEEVFWRHRSWPESNPGPKPPLSTVLPESVLRARVEDALRESNGLETIFKHPLTTEDLQAEMTRMAEHTKDPAMLREIFDALGNDPYRIAETLARAALADRLIRNGYAFDARFHGATRRAAERALTTTSCQRDLGSCGGRYSKTTWTIAADDEPAVDGFEKVDAAEWSRRIATLASRYATKPDDIPLGRRSSLQEDSDRFFATVIRERSSRSVTIEEVSWPKASFDAWWSEEKASVSSRLPAISGPLAYVAPAQTACVDDTWRSIPGSTLPDHSSGNTAVWTGSEMIVWGGPFGAEVNAGFKYNPATDSWSAISVGANVPAPRYAHTAVWSGSEMIVWGGLSPFGTTLLNTGGRYNPTTDTWLPTSTVGFVPSGRIDHTALWTGSAMIIWGGNPGGPMSNDGGRYDPATDTWTSTSTGLNVPTGRIGHTAVWTGTRMLVWGGQDAIGYSNSGALYDPSTNTWQSTSVANAPPPRYAHTAVWTGSQMIVWGGYIYFEDNPRSGGRYDPATDSWLPTSLSFTTPEPRHRHTAVWTGTQMIVWGGAENSTNELLMKSGGRYDPVGDAWLRTSELSNTPAARHKHTAVWTGNEMIVWGGSTSGTTSVIGGRYNPNSDSWLPTTSQGPKVRNGPVVLWTGTEMLVWGGASTQTSTADGDRYNPATDTWSSMPPAPTGGYGGSSGVWTGLEMIVWGGSNAPSAETAMGSRYNPTTNTWSSISSAGAPSRRSGAVAVWTGSEMIVWGGARGSAVLPPITYTYFTDGGRYVPSSDSWGPVSTLNAPVNRSTPAVWTGTEMVLWGGYNGTNALSTGARYRPSTNSWTSMSTSGAPAPRYFHSAVWTGTEVIVWGGGLNTGGRYSPATDTWLPTSTGANVPPPASGNSAVWNGSSMIVWGGSGVNTGGRYEPSSDSWRSISTGPPTLTNHQAVWTGSEMMVYSSYNQCAGARYCACVAASGIPTVTATKTGDVAHLSWLDLVGVSAYDVTKGSLEALRLSGGDFSLATTGCLANDITLATTDDTEVPAPGSGFWYLVRVTGCGTAGTYNTEAASQAGSRDAEIAASGGACP
jgi:N-acetylneuraminic acid mutarotase